jgi:hypothetical protein
MLTIKRKKDTRTVRACTNNCADIPGGVTVCGAELIPGTILAEGAAIAKGTDGLYHVIKTAKVSAAVGTSDTTIKVAKGSQFKVGDVIMAGVGSKAVAITAISKTDASQDVITIAEALGATVKEGAIIEQADKAAAKGAFRYTPVALVGDSYDVEELGNHLVTAVTIGQFKEAVVPPVSDDIRAALKTIVFI